MNVENIRPEQAAVIPVRRDAAGNVQVCLIRRKNASRWGIPKGYIDRGDGWKEAALTEAHEEAGLQGRLLGELAGIYSYGKGALTLTVAVGVMEVLEEHTIWREMRWRERRWCSIDEAGSLLEDHPVRPVYERVRSSVSALINTERSGD
jgi:8-oxo-dGTP pyrophosphatase MutT (NUDIX family)